VPQSTITLSLNCFKVPLIQKYWKKLRNHCIFQKNLTQIWKHDYIYTFNSFFFFRHKVQKFCFQSGTSIRSNQAIWPKCCCAGFNLLKFFWDVSLLIAFAQSKYGTNKFLDMTFEKVWKKANCMIIVSKIYFKVAKLPMLRFFGCGSRNIQ